MSFLSNATKIPEAASTEKAKLGLLRLMEVAEETADKELILKIKEIISEVNCRRFLMAVFGNSSFLGQCIIKDPGFLIDLIHRGPDKTFDKIVSSFNSTRSGSNKSSVMEFLRQARTKVALTIATADITNSWSGSKITQALSCFADLSVNYAINFLLQGIASKKIINLPENNNPGIGSGLIVLGLGKLGGEELNYSSDIDLILFFDPNFIETTAPEKLQETFIRLAKDLITLLSERTVDGYVFRTDLRLRPDPSSMPLAISAAAAETYYESIGQNWERAAMIKARPIAGDINAANSFLKNLQPFIWRKYLDFATIHDVHLIKRQINAHKGSSVVAVEGHNVKLGRGGIREIEFFAQTQQLIWGGRTPELRIAPTCVALVELSKFGQIDQKTAEELIEAYWFLRRVEHHLQMADDQQTHDLPKDKNGITHLAKFLGFKNSRKFREVLIKHLNRVESHYAKLFEEAPSINGFDQIKGNLVFTGTDNDPETLETIRNIGFSSPSSITGTVRSWHRGQYRALRSTRTRQILTELIPLILEAFAETTEPDAGFFKFDDFLSRLPSGVQLFSMFHAHPELLKLIAEIMGSAPRLAEHLGRNPTVLDSVLQKEFFVKLLTKDQLNKDISTQLLHAKNIEEVLDIVRRWANDKKLQIGIHALKHHSNWGKIGSSLTDLADISIQHLLEQVSKEFKIKHGRVKGEEKAVLALGKAGSQEMTPTSDLDLIFIYRHNAENKKSNGNYPLSPSHYYTRLGQRLINAITAQTSEGSLYSVDMRLRPSGNSGPIASSLSAFEKYHEDKSWTWEHMALSRARVITGTPRLIKDIENIIKATLTRKRNNEKLRMDVSSMRLLIDKKHQSDVIWDTKYIRGGLIDIEFIVQYLQLKNAHDNPNILATNTSDALKRLAKEKILTNIQIGKLNDALKLWQTIQGILRLTVQGFFRPKPEQEVPKALAQVMIDATGCSDIRELESRIVVSAKDVYEIYKNLIGNPIKTSSNEAS